MTVSQYFFEGVINNIYLDLQIDEQSLLWLIRDNFLQNFLKDCYDFEQYLFVILDNTYMFDPATT